jgi:hypothetical protein
MHITVAATCEGLVMMIQGEDFNRTQSGFTMSVKRILITTLLLVFPVSCAWGPGTGSKPPVPMQANLPSLRGFSGMAQLGPNSYLVVHDAKAHDDGSRLGVLEVTSSSGLRYSPVEIVDWKDPDGRSNDLESACALPQKPGEFLVAESGYWKGRHGRLFHVRVTDGKAQVLGAFRLPFRADSSGEPMQDNFEGMACVNRGTERFLVLLGERGGGALYRPGTILWGVLDLGQGSLDWANAGGSSLPVSAPGTWPAGAPKRDIADLYVQSDGVIWAAATADGGDNGPFRSLIYKVGTISGDPLEPVDIIKTPAVSWILDGMKVEALAAPAQATRGSVLSIGTEDENLGGVWRALYPAALDR